jgi:hypothetical protein
MPKNQGSQEIMWIHACLKFINSVKRKQKNYRDQKRDFRAADIRRNLPTMQRRM